jgi:hypothetical protein
LLLAESSAAINLGPPVTPTALLQITALQAGHSFRLTDYLAGAVPPKDQIAVGQSLTNLGAMSEAAPLTLSAGAH